MFNNDSLTETDSTGRRWILITGFVITLLITLVVLPVSAYDTPPGTIDPTTIQQFENVLTGAPPVWVPYHSDAAKDQYVINMSQFTQQILPPSMGLRTTVWGYGGQAKDAVTGAPLGFVRNSPAGTFEAQKGRKVEVKWVNDLTGPSLYAVDPTLHWASPNPACMLMDTTGTFPAFPPGFTGSNNQFSCNAQSPVPTVVHLHGAEVQSTSDGGPDQWFTASGLHGMDYFSAKKTDANAAIYEYPNTQPAATLFYHDHALGMTRLNVLSGLAGFYLLRDPGHEPKLIADKKYEIPLAIQDRIFQADDNPGSWKAGDFYFYPEGNSVADHPYWVPEFFGNTIMVNGLIWPKMDVDQTTYRLRFVDGSNARFYTMHFIDGNGNPVPFYQVGTDGGYLQHPVPLTELTIAPGERADLLIDFKGVAGPVTLTNTAKFPFPTGDDPVPGVDGTIMRFDIGSKVVASPPLPANLNNNIPDLSKTKPDVTRIRTLLEVANSNDEPVMVTLNGQRWMGALSETPAPGTIEDWVIVDTTMDTHPIHTHLTQFQVQSRQYMDTDTYKTDWIHKQWTNCTDYGLSSCGSLAPGTFPPWPVSYIPLELPIEKYLQGGPIPPAANEKGWKDTIQMSPDQVTTIRIRYSALDNSGHAPNFYAFDPTVGQGYVWHCHIIDHEDNEMMRPYKVVRNSPPSLKNPGDQTIAEGKTLKLNLEAKDPDKDKITFSFTSDKTLIGATLIGNTFSWTPPAGSAGKYVVSFKATDPGGLSDKETITITVKASPAGIPVTVKIIPTTVNLGTRGYFLAFVTLPDAYKGGTIDMITVSTSGAPAIRVIRIKIFPRIVGFVFRTSDLKGVQPGNKVPLTLQGQLNNQGIMYSFTGTDMVTVISKPAWQPNDIQDVSKTTDDQLFKKLPT